MIRCEKDEKSSVDATEDSEDHSVVWGMFMSSTLQAPVFMAKNYSDNWHSIKNSQDLTMKQMFDISEKLVSDLDEIYGVKTIEWEDYSWKYLSLIGDEQVISLQLTKVYVSQILYCVLVRYTRSPNQTLHGKKDWRGSKLLRNTEIWTELTATQWNSIGIFSQDSRRCS